MAKSLLECWLPLCGSLWQQTRALTQKLSFIPQLRQPVLQALKSCLFKLNPCTICIWLGSFLAASLPTAHLYFSEKCRIWLLSCLWVSRRLGFAMLTAKKDENWDLPFQIYTDIPFPYFLVERRVLILKGASPILLSTDWYSAWEDQRRCRFPLSGEMGIPAAYWLPCLQSGKNDD